MRTLRKAVHLLRGAATTSARALDSLAQNLRYAWRSLRHRPGLVAGVSLTLALGLGANAAMFGVVDRLFLQSPHFLRDPESVNRVYLAWRLAPGTAWRFESGDRPDAHVEMSYGHFIDLTRWTRAFAQTAAFASYQQTIGSGLAARQVMVGVVSASYFRFFDAPPIIGRYFTAEEDQAPEGAAVAVLSYAYWQSQYAGRSSVLGTPLRIGRAVFTVIGVAPKGFDGIGDANPYLNEPTSPYSQPIGLYVPVTAFGARLGWFGPDCRFTSHCDSWLEMIVRRRPGVTTEMASSNLTAAFQWSYAISRSEDSAERYTEWQIRRPRIEIARPRAFVGPLLAERGPLATATARVASWVAGVAAIVLLIACANVANLLLTSARQRRGEIALRLALGVSQSRLVSQLLLECLLLAVIAGVAALLVARFGAALVAALFLPTGDAAGLLHQPRTLAFAAIATLLAGVLTGVLPALQARRTDVIDALKGARRGGSGDASSTRAVLLVVQGALSVVLLVGAGLFVRSVEQVRALPLGMDVDHVLYAITDPRGTELDSAGRRLLGERMVDAVRPIPGVVGATRIAVPPLVGWMGGNLFLPGRGNVDAVEKFTAQEVSPEYFALMGTHIIRGRGFTGSDVAGAPRVAVVSEAMARLLWPGQEAIGQRMQVDFDTAAYTTVVGIAENLGQYDASAGQELHYYLPLDQVGIDLDYVEVLVRTRGNAKTYETPVRRALQSVMPGATYVDLAPMQRLLEPDIRSWQLGEAMFLIFGCLALVVAMVGLYSVISYDAARRTHELGVRIALGARMRHVLGVVAADSSRFAGIGVVLGGVIALAAAPLVAPLLFHERPRDPVVFVIVAVALAVAVIVATIGPVVRASRIDPGAALRAE